MTYRGIFLTMALPLAAGCAHSSKDVAAETPPAPAVAAAPPAEPEAAAPATRGCSSDDQCSAKELCVSSRCVAITAELAECRASAHFEFDRWDVRQADQPVLQRAARCASTLRERTLVEGNCDERGTAQYNVALGFRRAHAVAKYLADLGVPSGIVSEVSYGKERPRCTEATEACWAKNRRADLERGAGAKATTADSPAR